MLLSQSDLEVPSPGSSRLWVRVHLSTSRTAPVQICVLIDVRRFVVKKVGEVLPGQVVVDVQTWSTGTSGQWAAFASVRCASAQVIVPLGRQRSLTLKFTQAGGTPVVSLPTRSAYSIFV